MTNEWLWENGHINVLLELLGILESNLEVNPKNQ